MHVTLYKYTGERNKVDKGAELTEVLQTSGQFKADTSILNPSLLLSLPVEQYQEITDGDGNEIADVVTGVNDEILNFNYFYIAEFRRFYYVSNIVVSSNHLLLVSGEVDPLYSFASQILENEGMIERNEFDLDPMLEDTLLPLELTKDVSEEIPTRGELVNTRFRSEFANAQTYSRNIVITTITDQSNSFYELEPPTGSGLPKIAQQSFSSIGSQVSYRIEPNDLINIGWNLLNPDKSERAVFIKSIIALPYEIPNSDVYGHVYIHVGRIEDVDSALYVKGELTNPIKGYLTGFMSPYKIIADFNLPVVSSFLDLSPYTHYEIYLPFFGWHEIDLKENLSGHRVLVYYAVNYEDGSATVYLYDYTARRALFSAPCQLGTKLAITKSNAEEINKQREAQNTSLAIGLISSALSIGAGAAGNPLLLASGIMGGVSTIAGYVNTNALMFERASATFGGSNASLYTFLDVRLRTTKNYALTGLNPLKYSHQYGRPLKRIRKLSTLSGFTQIGSVHLHDLDATDAEKQQIESSLLSGVLL